MEQDGPKRPRTRIQTYTNTEFFFCALGWGRFCPAFRCLSQDEEMRTGHPTHPLHGRRLLRCCHGNSSSHQQQQQQQQQQQYGPVMHRPGGVSYTHTRTRVHTQRKKESTSTRVVFATPSAKVKVCFLSYPGAVRSFVSLETHIYQVYYYFFL